MVGTVAIPDVQFCNLVIFVSHAVILVLQPLTAVIAIAPAAKLTVPDDTVKPLLHVNKFVDVIVFDVKVPVLVIAFDVIKELLFILILLINPVVFNVFKYDEPETFNDKVFTLSEDIPLELNKSRLYIIGI